MPTPFVHLHNHSEFSLLDGATKIKDMVKYAVDNDMPAIAITDHGMMYGCYEFYQAARKAGIKPLIGVEAYVATRTRHQKEAKKDGNHHLVAIAKNYAGYKNLLKLTTKASLEGFYHKPRIDKELLAEHSEGLIICSACMGGELAHAIREGKGSLEGVRNTAAWYREVFGEDYYLEIQGHGATGQDEINDVIKQIAGQMGIKMVATNDAHYLRKEDADAHDVLICIQTGTNIDDPKRMKYLPQEFYLKSYDEMWKKFENFAPDALHNTLEIAEKCNLEIETGRVPMPSVALPEGKTPHEHMSDLCREGLTRRIKTLSDVHRDRLDYELGIIEQTGFSQYFLIVMDISNYARSSGIYFGVRGSAAGSLASYCLGITDLDPVEYNLTFERFLNPERVSMPDIDMDFEDTKRADVIEHVTKHYGKENVAYITTFGTMGAKAAIRDSGRALGMPLPDVDRIARMIPSLPLGVSIDKAINGWPEKDVPANAEFQADYQNNPQTKKLIDTAKRLEGMSRNASVHAAGIMIADRPLVEYTPLELRNGLIVTQFPHSSLESIGLLKMDFLGLSNLTILANSVKLIKEKRNVDIDVWDIPLDYSDPRAKRAYDMLGRGETTGVFQLESAGMRKYIVDLKPNSVKELAAMVALYRPGPLAHIPRFINCKFDPEKIKYAHPLLEPILKETYGVIVYQDQVLKIVQAIGGFSLGQADILRRAMGKKQAKYMEEQKINYLKGAAEKGIKDKVAEQIFAEIEPFAGYAFNGAHAACYAMVAYQTAYLKANYPAEYLAALMGAYIDNTEKVVNTIEECERLGVTVRPPCVNESVADFTVNGETIIQFGLMAIKNVGKAPIDAILSAREKGGKFTSLEDFCNRVFAEGLTSKSVIEMLIKAGTFAAISENRRALLEILDDCTTAAARGAKDAKAGLISLWGDEPSDDNAAVRGVSVSEVNVTDFSRGERLGFEKELLGIYLTEHPIKPFEAELKRKFKTMRIDELKETQPNQEVIIGGMITAVRTVYTKEGKQMLIVTLEDTTGNIGVTCFTKTAAEFGRLVIQNAVIAVRGKAQHRERFNKNAGNETEEAAADKNVQIEVIAQRIDQVVPDAMAADARVREVYVRIDSSSKTILRMVAEEFSKQEGGSPLFLKVETPSGEHTVKTKLMVSPDEAFLDQVRKMLGGGARRAWIE